MVLNAASLRAAATGHRALFLKGFEYAQPVHMPFMEETTSTGAIETYHFGGDLPQLREWIGERQIQNLDHFDFELKNKTWESTIAISREAFEDDALGTYAARIRGMGAAAALHPDVLFAELLEGGWTGNAYDGKKFFAANHSAGRGATQSNTTDALLDADAFDDGVKSILSRKDAKGQPIDVTATGGELHLIVPPALRATALDIVERQLIDGGDSNRNYKAAKVVVYPRLTSATKWYLIQGGGMLRPFVKQVRRKPELVEQYNPDDPSVLNKNEFLFAMSGRWNCGYGLWQLAYGSDGTGS